MTLANGLQIGQACFSRWRRSTDHHRQRHWRWLVLCLLRAQWIPPDFSSEIEPLPK